MAEFSLVCMKQNDAVNYRCQCQVAAPLGMLKKNNPVELVLTDHNFPPPTISMSTEELVETGTNVTIQCRYSCGGTTFLHKDGHSAPVQHQNPSGRGMDTFTFLGATPADTSTFPKLLLPHGNQWRWPSSWVSDSGDVVPQGMVALCGTWTMSLAGWWLVAAIRAQHHEVSPVLVPRPSLSLHPSQGVSLGDTVTLRCHLPRLAAWVQLWFNGTLRSDKEKDKEEDTVEFSLVVTNLEDTGTYQCRYQVSEPLWTSNMSDPVELVVTGAKGQFPHGNRVVAVVRGCAAVFIFCLGLYFVLDARSLWTQRDESPGVPPGMSDAVQIQLSACVSGPQIPTCPLGPALDITMDTQILSLGTSNDPQPHMAHPDIYVHHLNPDHGNPKSELQGIPHPTVLNTQAH
ncbi:uncharacterized protein LOC110391926 [Numida meleagris]|uniref:uncharacterized protein LOC110391926 n=1 Tax=Numida meleagris TaxID=8996 RepID=UPI000B3D894F|nr:uncharacterized protein LOC110391926 [Numida meleagris]